MAINTYSLKRSYISSYQRYDDYAKRITYLVGVENRLLLGVAELLQNNKK